MSATDTDEMEMAESEDGSAVGPKRCQTACLGMFSFVTATLGGPPRRPTSSAKTIRLRLRPGESSWQKLSSDAVDDVVDDSESIGNAAKRARLSDENSIGNANKGDLIWRPLPSAVKGVIVDPFVATAGDVVSSAADDGTLDDGDVMVPTVEATVVKVTAVPAVPAVPDVTPPPSSSSKAVVSSAKKNKKKTHANYSAVLPFACKIASDSIAVKAASTACGGELFAMQNDDVLFKLLGDDLK